MFPFFHCSRYCNDAAKKTADMQIHSQRSVKLNNDIFIFDEKYFFAGECSCWVGQISNVTKESRERLRFKKQKEFFFKNTF
jgi:hypothetical protein